MWQGQSFLSLPRGDTELWGNQGEEVWQAAWGQANAKALGHNEFLTL